MPNLLNLPKATNTEALIAYRRIKLTRQNVNTSSTHRIKFIRLILSTIRQNGGIVLVLDMLEFC